VKGDWIALRRVGLVWAVPLFVLRSTVKQAGNDHAEVLASLRGLLQPPAERKQG
jgi:hypothetical protein